MRNMLFSIFSVCLVVFLAAEAKAVTFKGWAEGSWSTVVAGGERPWSTPADPVNVTPYSSGNTGIPGDYQPGDPDPEFWTDLIYHTTNEDIGAEAVFDWGLTYDPTGANDPTPTNPRPSSFTFDGSFSDPGETKEPVVIPDDNPIMFGTFDYFNGSTYYSDYIFGVSLSVNFHVLDVDENAVADFNMVFDFGIVNVSNSGGDTPDIVQILNQTELSRTFNYDGQEYLFDVKGFAEKPEDDPKWIFSSPEGVDSPAGLYAEINPVPEPTTMLLFGTGLLGLFCSGRSLKKRR